MTAPGYILPSSTVPVSPANKALNLTQFIQTVLVGVSGLPGTLVRPKWQKLPPENPDIDTNWISFGITSSAPDSNAFLGVNSLDKPIMQRHETLEIACSLYGPDGLEIADLIRDGFQVPVNLQALTQASMGFVETSRVLHVPDLVNERFVNRYEMGVFLRREIQRVYPIPTLLSASGRIHTVTGSEQYLLDWAT